MTDSSLNRFLRVLPFIAVAVVAFFQSLTDLRLGDSIGYTFLVSSDPDYVSNTPLKNFTDLLTSQYNHYFAVNGRFIVHVIVQIFCAFLPAWCFALCNAAVYVAVIVQAIKLAGFSKMNELSNGSLWVVCSLFFIMIRPDNFQPPLLINYIWMSLLVLITLRFFISSTTSSPGTLCFLALLAFITGEGNETFSIPIALLFLGYAIVKKFRLSAPQWVMGPSFALGTIILCLAPGNFVRMNDVNAIPIPFMYQLEYFAVALIPLLILTILTFLPQYNRQNTEVQKPLWILVILSFATCFAFHFSSGVRMATPAFLAIFTLSVPVCASLRHKPVVIAVISAAMVIICQFRDIGIIHRKYDHAINEEYPESDDGRVYIPDSLFSFQFRQLPYHALYFSRREQALNPETPDILLLPETLREIPRDTSLNICRRLDRNSWLIIRSKTSPARFILHKSIGIPGFIKKLTPRELNFGHGSDILIDSTEYWSAAYYVNDRAYIMPEIVMEP